MHFPRATVPTAKKPSKVRRSAKPSRTRPAQRQEDRRMVAMRGCKGPGARPDRQSQAQELPRKLAKDGEGVYFSGLGLPEPNTERGCRSSLWGYAASSEEKIPTRDFQQVRSAKYSCREIEGCAAQISRHRKVNQHHVLRVFCEDPRFRDLLRRIGLDAR